MVTVFVLALVGRCSASPVQLGNLIASVNTFTGHQSAPRYVAEYTSDGQQVQNLHDHVNASNQLLRDLVVGPDHAVYVVYGSSSPQLIRIAPNTLQWSAQTFAGWDIQSTESWGGIATYGSYIFVGDKAFGTNGTDGGIIRFDTVGGTPIRFGEHTSRDLTMGLDGKLYSLREFARVEIFDPNTLSQVGTFDIPSSGSFGVYGVYSAVAAAADGSMYITSSNGWVVHFSPTGQLLGSLNVHLWSDDIDISPTGAIALGSTHNAAGTIALTDVTLASYSQIKLVENGDQVFVAWAPEPPSFSLLCFAALCLASFVFKRRRDHTPHTPELVR
jgi:hypothetical protein